MPRIAGQIDVAKGESILDAAATVFAERGLGAGVEDIARRACVSKQTIYNHYGSKAELLRAIAARGVREITAHLDMPGAVENPQEALKAFGRVLLRRVLDPRAQGLTRVVMLGAVEMPDIATALYEAGPEASRLRLAEFLRLENKAGRLDAPDPEQAAEIFAAMVAGPYQLANILGANRALDEGQIEAVAAEAALRFMRAYAPAPAAS